MAIDIKVTGTPGAKSRPQGYFDSANAFYEAAKRSAEPVEDPYNQKNVLCPMSPTIVSIAFATELYLKSIILITSGKVRESHRLDRLFNDLSKDHQKKLRRRYAELSGEGKLDLPGQLVAMSNAFVDWRYIAEGLKDVRLDRLFHLARALYDLIREEQPEWPVGQFLNERITTPFESPVMSVTSLGGGTFVRTVLNPTT